MIEITQVKPRILQADALPDPDSMPDNLLLVLISSTDKLYVLKSDAGVRSWVDVSNLATVATAFPISGDGTAGNPITLADGVLAQAKFNTALLQKLGYVDVNFYVDSVNGSNSNDGSQAHPFQTLAFAISRGPSEPRGKYRINLIGAGPYTFPEKWEGCTPVDFTGEPLLILGQFDAPVLSGTLSAASGATATVSGGGLTTDAYRGLTYHGKTGTSANKYYTIATNSTTQLSSLANTFGAATNDTFEILTPLTVITGADLQINGPSKIGFYACKFTNTTWEFVGDCAVLFDACISAQTSRFRSNYGARMWFAPMTQAPDFYFITDAGTQLGQTGMFFTSVNALVTFETNSITRGWLCSSRFITMDNGASAIMFGFDLDISARSNTNGLTCDYESLFRQNSGWARVVGGTGTSSGIIGRHGATLDLAGFVMTNCPTAAVNLQTGARATMQNVTGSTGNGAGVLLSDAATLFNISGNTVSGTSGAIIADSSSTAIPWSQAGTVLSASSAVPLKFTATKTFASHTALVSTDRYVPLDSSGGAFSQSMPAANTLKPGDRIQVQDQAGQCGANPVTMSRAGSDTFQGGGTTFAINQAFGGATFQSDGTSVWYVVNRVLV